MDIYAVFNQQPSDNELDSAPFLKAWRVKGGPLSAYSQLWGWMYGHPTVGEGSYAHTSPVIAFDASTPPRWARTESRLYRLGDACGPIEWQIRLLARSLKIRGERTEYDDAEDEIDARENPYDGGWPTSELDEVEQMIVNMRRFRNSRVTLQKLDGLWRLYRDEKYPRAPDVSS